MFNPDGYLPVPHIVAWIAILGARGELPQHFGPPSSDGADDPMDNPPEVTARFILGEKMAAGKLVAQAVMHVDGSRKLIPSSYWSSPAANDTMVSGFVDMGVFGYERDLYIVHAILAVDDVQAALGFRMVSSAEEPPQEEMRTSEMSAVPVGPTAAAAGAPLSEWLLIYARNFVAKHGRPPGRDHEAVPDASVAGYAVHQIRAAYAKLPGGLKVPARRPRKSERH